MKIKKIIFIIILISTLVLSLTPTISYSAGNNAKILENGIYQIAVQSNPNEVVEIKRK